MKYLAIFWVFCYPLLYLSPLLAEKLPKKISQQIQAIPLWEEITNQSLLKKLNSELKKSGRFTEEEAPLRFLKINKLEDKINGSKAIFVKVKKSNLILNPKDLEFSSDGENIYASGDLKDNSGKKTEGEIFFETEENVQITIELSDGQIFLVSPFESTLGARGKNIYTFKKPRTGTPTPTISATPTLSPVPTTAATATPIPTLIPTLINTTVPTSISTPAATVTQTIAPTFTQVWTATNIPASTATPTATRTRTSTPSSTHTSTPTRTNTPSPTGTPPPTGWFETNLQDPALRIVGSSLYQDNIIDRNDIIALLREVQAQGTVSNTALSDLQLVANTSSLFGSLEHVRKLTRYIALGNTANSKFQGAALGNLAAGSSADHLGKLIDKWFLGKDRPTASGTYRQFAGNLFVGGAAYTDVRQGGLGDCYLLATLGETPFRSPSTIPDIFIVNGDGTYTVKLSNNGSNEYVTVDTYLPTNGSGNLTYAGRGQNYNNTASELWTALAEKAYIQANEMGWIRPGLPGSGQNSYASIDGGYIYAALGHINGRPTSAFRSTSSSTALANFTTAWNSGKLIGFASFATPQAGSGIVGSHAYAVVGFNPETSEVTLFNPWGIEYGLITMNWDAIKLNFAYFDQTA